MSDGPRTGSQTAFIFPGQGSQAVGMGKALADNFPAAKAVFDEVDAALNESLTQVMWDGPIDALTLTANAQPALMAVSLAALRVLETEAGLDLAREAAFVAGHSLGEYSALAAAGALTITEAARLLRIRGRAMQEAVRAIVIAKEKGAMKALLLPVSAPFHCRLMGPAAEAMEVALSGSTVMTPRVPLVANVRASPVTDPAEIVRLLVEQVTGTVRWRESVIYMAGAGVTRMVEIGAGKVLCGLVKRIDKSVSTSAVGTAEDVAAFIAARNAAASAA